MRPKLQDVPEATLNGVLDYCYDTMPADDETALDARRLCLALLGCVRHGSLKPFSEACFQVFGCTLEKRIERRAARKEYLNGMFRATASAAASAALDARVRSSVSSPVGIGHDTGRIRPQDTPTTFPRQPLGNLARADREDVGAHRPQRIQDSDKHDIAAG